MKILILISALFMSLSSFAVDGKIDVNASRVKPRTIELIITGDAAEKISDHLRLSRVPFRRDARSGALIQSGDGIQCIGRVNGHSLYCYIEVTGRRVN